MGSEIEKQEPSRKETLMQLNTGKQGRNAVWKDYEDEAITYLLRRGIQGASSGNVFAHVLFVLSEAGKSISRASIIFFLNRLVEDGLANFDTRTGKGGHHRVYSLIDRTRVAFNNSVIDKFLYKLWETYPDNEKIAELIKL